ncbi:MAG: hypothetical protein R3208_09115, partial [Ketobacteraceae bacterium]|nr:hypothetical protein [Ketobacteraceae bacterium]
QPNIMIVTDANKQRRKKPAFLDIYSLNQSLAEGKSVGSPIEIKKSYPAGSFNIWPHEYRYQQDSLIERLLG